MANPSPSASNVHLRFAKFIEYSHRDLERFAQCPLSFRLHEVDRLPADVAIERHFGNVVHRVLADTVREHVMSGRIAPLDPELAAAAYRREWEDSDLQDHALFADGLALVRRWAAREGVVDPAHVLALNKALPLHLGHLGNVRLWCVMDRVDRTGDDAVRVRDYKTTRMPSSRQDAEGSLRLALYDLAARELWPWAKRVEVSFDLLRHDVVVAVEKTDEQREATRRYVLATVGQMQRGEYAPRASTHCARCDHRAQCPAYAEARAGKRTHVGAQPHDLPAVAREREEIALLLKALGERKDALDAILRAELDRRDELVLEGHRYSLVTAVRRDYPLSPTLLALDAAGVPRQDGLARIGSVDGSELKALLGQLAKILPREDFLALKQVLDAQARCSPVARLTVREVRS